MKYYIVQGKERNDSADHFFTYHYSGDFTFNELKRKAHLEYCDDAGYEEGVDGKYFIDDYKDSEYPIEVSLDIWDIFQSDTPITDLKPPKLMDYSND